MIEHVGYDSTPWRAVAAATPRNGTRAKTVLTGQLRPGPGRGPPDREGSFEPVIVKAAAAAQ